MTPDDQSPAGTAAIETDVFVAGGGSTALFAALLVARAGHSVLLVTAEPEFEPAGAGISPLVAPPTLGLLAEQGLEEEILGSGQRVLGVDDHGPAGLLHGWRYADFPGITRPYGLTLPTGTLVQALLRRLRAEPTATVRTNARVTAVDQDDNGVLLTLTDSALVRARYAVAADGRRSPLRDLTGISLHEASFGRPGWLVAAPVVPDREPVALVRHPAPQVLFTIPTPNASMAVVWCPGPQQAEALGQGDPEVFAAQIKAVDPELSDWLGKVRDRTSPVFRVDFSMWQAASWRAGRVLLLGEAAHGLHTLGGQGLNQSVQSAASLAHALDDALTHGDPSRAGAYERIRRPFVERLQELQWSTPALRSYSAEPPARGAHEDFVDVMTNLQPELAAQLRTTV
ncbi:FAD-dependent oxidoreductase [Winogradskya humida]|uniref:2-octaprenyl-3-methyl-6-methoxy-1,4-benzoquinol hydroxylase n=1 Tax=Winogradskya humida TaxID=113566 RepID=A0ABQ3ZWR2_9ACTN|nr:NAD(P)/FAD-dependent oxidoreductase [Actinoplanes humidus]GIE23040.1 2-octaprenyl-3-methyl-6-methoxy-1,4-benzoquinol hydroxylase [Actinoplanes humidus]